MTKDGRPSVIEQIRLFADNAQLSCYMKDLENEVAFAKRLAWWLNGLKVSVGSHIVPYVRFTPELPEGVVEICEPLPGEKKGETELYRYVKVGVPKAFPDCPDASVRVVRGIINSLKAFSPENASVIDEAAEIVAREGENLRFLVKSHETRKYLVEVTCMVRTGVVTGRMFVSLIDKITGTYNEATPMELRFKDDAFKLTDKIRIGDDAVIIMPRPSFEGQLVSKPYNLVNGKAWPLSDFKPAIRPVTSEQLRVRT